MNENWGLIMDICDKIGNSSLAAKESLKIIVKRLNNPDPHVVVKAITVSVVMIQVKKRLILIVGLRAYEIQENFCCD